MFPPLLPKVDFLCGGFFNTQDYFFFLDLEYYFSPTTVPTPRGVQIRESTNAEMQYTLSTQNILSNLKIDIFSSRLIRVIVILFLGINFIQSFLKIKYNRMLKMYRKQYTSGHLKLVQNYKAYIDCFLWRKKNPKRSNFNKINIDFKY